MRIDDSPAAFSTDYMVVDDFIDEDGDLHVAVYDGDSEGLLGDLYLTAESRRMLASQLRTVKPEVDEPERMPLGPADVAAVEHSAVEAVMNLAGQYGRTVEFSYAKPSNGAIEHRRLAPSDNGVQTAANGAKYVAGWDPDRQEPRSYRLDRITGGVLLRAE